MKFSSREEIAAPVPFVFDQLSDFLRFERAAMRRGVELRRLDTLAAPGAGMSWDTTFTMRAKRRQMIVDLRVFDRPGRLAFNGASGSFEVMLDLLMTPITPLRTRLQVGCEIRPRSIGGRLLIQSAKLGRSKLDRRFAERLRAFALEIEDRARDAGNI